LIGYFRTLLVYLRGYRGLAIILLLVLFLQTAVLLFFPVAYKEIFDGVAAKKEVAYIVTWLVVIVGAIIVRITVGLICDYLVGIVTCRTFGEIRLHFFRHLQWLPAEFYQRVHLGELISQYSHDLQNSEIVTRSTLPVIIRSFFSALLSLAILFYYDWRLTLFALALFPIVLLGGLLFMKKASSATRSNQIANAKLSALMEEVAVQHLLLQAFNMQKELFRRFKQNLENYEKEFVGGVFLRTLVGRTSVFGLTIVEIVVFSMGAIMALHGQITIGTLFGFFAFIWNISGAVVAISNGVPNLIQAGQQMQRLREILLEKTDAPNDEETPFETKTPTIKEMIVLEHVSLSYGDQNVLENLSSEITSGESIGLVGSTGSGKTSILSLIMGYHFPTKGKILFDGEEIAELNRDLLRTQIGIVFQHNPLFNLSLRENIRIGRLEATDEEVEEAAKAAEIHDFILSLPQGYDSPVKEYGTNLSGGQKQRIALARVYLRSPSLFLLDEPTSALDPIVETQINETILKQVEKKTVIMCTHRLAALTEVDQILVLDQGKLVEKGSHKALMELKGRYYQLWQKQHTAVFKEKEKRIKVDLSLFQHIPLFRKFDKQKIEEIADRAIMEWKEEGTILQECEYLNKFYLIARGRVEVRKVGASPAEPPLKVFEEGDYFGDLSFLKNIPPNAEIITLSHCVFFVLREESL